MYLINVSDARKEHLLGVRKEHCAQPSWRGHNKLWRRTDLGCTLQTLVAHKHGCAQSWLLCSITVGRNPIAHNLCE